MNSLVTLKRMVLKLNVVEFNLLVRRFERINVQNGKSKTILLINLLKNNNYVNSSEIQNILNPNSNYLAFNKLCNRLKNAILEVIIDDSSLEFNQYSYRNKQLLFLRKKIIQADILLLKGLNEELLSMYNSIIKRSAKFEFYDIQLQALNSKSRFLTSYGKTGDINKIKKEIFLCEKNYFNMNKSISLYQGMMNLISKNSDSSNYLIELKSTIDELQELLNLTKSKTIKYFLLNLEVELLQTGKQYSDANNLLVLIEKLLLSSPAVYTENRYGTILLNIANNYLFIGNFNSAIEFAKKSKSYFEKYYFTMKLVDELLFYCHFYKNEFSKIEDYLILDSGKARDKSNELIFSKFNYYKACLEFTNGNYLTCIETLNDNKEIDKDKEGWNVCKRILIILCRIELEDLESVDLSVNNLNRYYRRLSKTNIVKGRYKQIIKICLNLINDNCDKNAIKLKFNKYNKLFDMLSSEANKWVPKSPELINFEEWFHGRYY